MKRGTDPPPRRRVDGGEAPNRTDSVAADGAAANPGYQNRTVNLAAGAAVLPPFTVQRLRTGP
jgi:hypothetical protein